MISHSFSVRIRYGETDQMGVVYHGNYPQFFEISRTEWLRFHGISYSDMEESGVMLPVIYLACNFKKSAVYDEVITIKTSLKKKPTVKIEFDHEITNQKGEIITTGTTILAFISKHTNKPMRCPEYILKKLNSKYD